MAPYCLLVPYAENMWTLATHLKLASLSSEWDNFISTFYYIFVASFYLDNILFRFLNLAFLLSISKGIPEFYY